MNTLATRMATLMLGGALLFSACGDDDETQKTRTITDLVVEGAEFSTLESALVAAGLDETLEGAGPFTVFAPTNAAFAKLPAGTVEGLLKPEAKGTLTAVLTYHVVAGKVDAKALIGQIKAGNGKATLTTVQGGKLVASIVGNDVALTDAKGGTSKVTATDLAAKNGLIHVIDTVVMP